MKICQFCQSPSPDHALFCAQCGQRIVRADDSLSGDSLTSILPNSDATEIVETNTSPLVSSDKNVYASASSSEQEVDLEHEILYPFDNLDEVQTFSITSDTAKEDDEDDDSLLPLPPLPVDLLQTPNNIPVQNPLQVGQIPYSGQPSLSTAPPVPYSAQPYLSAQLAQVAPIQTLNLIPPPPPPYVATSPTSPHPHTPHPSGPGHRPHLPGVRPTCLVLVVLGFIGLSILGFIIITFFPKAPSTLTPTAHLIGIPIPGQKMILYGGKFVPGETVIVVIDQQASAFSSAQSINRMSISALFGQHAVQTPSKINEIVRVDGTFSLTFPVDPKWPIGSVHTVYVYKHDGTLVKLPPFTVVAPTDTAGLKGCSDQATAIKLGPIDENSTQPVSKTIALCTQGSGLVKWQANWQQAWLKLPLSGQIQAPQTGTLPATGSAKGLKPGAYTATVTLSSKQNHDLVRLTIVLVVTKAGTVKAQKLPPASTHSIECISVAPQAVSFTSLANGPDALSKSVEINNCGTGQPWSATVSTNNGKAWLGINTTQGNIPGSWFQEVIVTASSATLPSGTYTGQVTFRTGTNSIGVKVTFTVLPPTTTSSCISVAHQSLTFVSVAGQDEPPSQTATLINCGATGQWSASAVTDNNIDWLHISPASNLLKANGQQQVEVRVSSDQLKGGTYTAKITFFLGTSSVKVNVTFTVQEACIQVDYPALLFKSHVDDSSLRNIITITNCGYAGTWYASTATDDGTRWLTINKISGSLVAKAQERIAVDVSSAHLHEGMYTGDILFIMGTSRITVQVKFVIIKLATPPCLSLNKDGLNFVTNAEQRPDAQVLTIGNCGSVAVSWHASTNGNKWINIDIPKGDLKQSGDTQDIRISLLSEHLAPAIYVGKITLSDGIGSKDVSITLTVQKPIIPCITVDKSRIEFSAKRTSDGIVNPGAQTVKITNCGSPASLSVPSATNDVSTWLGVNPFKQNLDTGEVSGASIAVDSSGLNNGTYTATIPFTVTVSTGAHASVNVQILLTIVPPAPPTPCTASPSKLTFTSDWEATTPPSQPVTLLHCGANDTLQVSDVGGMFNFNASSDTLDDNGSLVVGIVPDSSMLDPGQYTDTITFTTGAGKTTSIEATWIIVPPKDTTCIQSDSSSLSFDQSTNGSGVVTFTNCGTDAGSIKVTKATDDCGHGSSISSTSELFVSNVSCADWLAIDTYGDSSIDGSGSFPTGYGPSISVTAYSTNMSVGQHHGTITGIITNAQGLQKVATINVTFTVSELPTPPLPTYTPTPTDTPVATDTPTPTDTPVATDTPTPGVTPTDTATPTDTPVATDTPTPGVTPTDTATDTPTPEVTPTDTPVATDTPTPTPGVTPTDTPTPEVTPTDTPTSVPTDTPTPVPTDTPTPTPTDTPPPLS